MIGFVVEWLLLDKVLGGIVKSLNLYFDHV